LLFTFMTSSAQELEITQEIIDTLSLRFRYEENYQLIKKALQDDGNLVGWTRYYMWKSYKAYVEKKTDSSIYYADEAHKYYLTKEKGYWTADINIHKALYFKGLTQYFDKNIEPSLQSLNIALEYAEAHPPTRGETSWRFFILERISIIHIQKGDYEFALKSKRKISLDTTYMSRKYEGGSYYNSIGELYSSFISK